MDDDSHFRIDGTANDDELVDTFQIVHNLSVGQWSLRQNYSGIYGFATVDLAIAVKCDGNFQGSACTQCLPGFSETLCEIEVNSEINKGAGI